MMQLVSLWGLQLRLRLARLGLANLLALLFLVAGAVAWLVLLPELHSRLRVQQQILPARLAQYQAGQLPAAAAPPRPSVRALAAFYDTLGDSRYAEQQLKTMFAIAAGLGLQLDLAQYKSAADDPGRFQTYQIVLPVKGSYQQIRQFCEQMLAAVPFAALDEMDLQRDAASESVLQARLRFTLFLVDPRRLAGGPGATPTSHGGKP